MPNVRADQLKSMAEEIFSKKGAPEEHARLVSELLVRANLAGHDSHGVVRIPWYVSLIDEGRLDPKARAVIEVDRGAIGLANGNSGFGQVVATQVMENAIEKAAQFGVSAYSIHNCGHVGRMADYSLMAEERGMIGITMVNSIPVVAPFGGVERMFNPSPLGAALPAGADRNPFLLDISMSTCAEGKITVTKARGGRLPPGWIIDKDGTPSTDPEDYFNGGSILPIGGNVGYKGYGLAFLVDILAGALSGNGTASSGEFRGGNGVLMLVIDVRSFGPLDVFERRVAQTIDRVRNSKKAPGVKEILIPGDPEFLEEQKRLKEGVFVEDLTWNKISSLASTLGVPIPSPITSNS